MPARAGRARAVLGALAVLAALSALAPFAEAASEPAVVRVGSKAFTESYVVGEIVAQVVDRAGEVRAQRKLGLGGTGIVIGALVNGDIDVYVEYTGTIARVILEDPSMRSLEALRGRLSGRGLAISDPLGFENSYALAVRRDTAERLGLRTISDLRRHPGLTAAFDPGFAERADGWPGLRSTYSLSLADVRVMEHALTYPALTSGQVDVIDVFSTDGQLARHGLVVLADDRQFFPDYAAVLLVKASFPRQFPRTWAALQRHLVGRIDTATMARLNAQADLERRPFASVAAAFLGDDPRGAATRLLGADIVERTLEHLRLVAVALGVAVVLGIPLGILAARHRLAGQLGLVGAGVFQTVPALALLAFMIPLFGIGEVPALVALSLYGLLPIVRNTHAGLIALDAALVEMTSVLGLTSWQRLTWIELPLASIAIVAGIKTSAVMTVGTATLAAFIGGGGYGTLIVTGLALNDVPTILAGAVPAALMALAIHGAFEGVDRLAIPRSLRMAAVRPPSS